MSRSTITPHPSHTWGTVEGERRCKRCWSAPTWAIIEEPCPSEGRARDDDDGSPREHGFAPWTDADVAHAYELYLARVPVAEIAATIGRTLHATRDAGADCSDAWHGSRGGCCDGSVAGLRGQGTCCGASKTRGTGLTRVIANWYR